MLFFQQLTDASALQQWYTTTSQADTTALVSLQTDVNQWDTGVSTAWQTEADTELNAVETSVHAWALQSGTRFANWLDAEMSAWTTGETADVSSAVTAGEASFADEIQSAVKHTEDQDTTLNAGAADTLAAVQTEAGEEQRGRIYFPLLAGTSKGLPITRTPTTSMASITPP